MARRALLILALLLGSCASETPQSVSKDDTTCQSYGAAPGSEAYTQCRVTLAHDRRLERRARLNAIGNVLSGTGEAIQSTPVRPSSATMTCMKTGEQVSGMNKLCGYNCLGSGAVETIGVAELCPLTIER